MDTILTVGVIVGGIVLLYRRALKTLARRQVINAKLALSAAAQTVS